jgi:hypothetical protein
MIVMIQFRCWYCNKRYSVPEARIGQRLTCTCQRLLRVPRSSGGPCRVKTLTDWVVEGLVYGLGGGFVGMALAVLILSQSYRFGVVYRAWVLVPALTLLGLLVGLLGGERGIGWLRRIIRDREDR